MPNVFTNLYTNYAPQVIRGLRGAGREVYNAGRSGLNLALSNKLAMYGTMAGGAGLYMATRNSNSRLVRGAGTVGLLGAGAIGFAGAYRGMMGSHMQYGAARAASFGLGAASKGLGYISRMLSRVR